MINEIFNDESIVINDPSKVQKYIPKDYNGTLPFDRFGSNGHNFYSPEHSDRYGHYCSDWDGLYICEDCEEFKSCTCFKGWELTEEEKLWLEEIYPRLEKVADLCASKNIPFKWKFGARDLNDKFTISIELDKNRNYTREIIDKWEEFEND